MNHLSHNIMETRITMYRSGVGWVSFDILRVSFCFVLTRGSARMGGSVVLVFVYLFFHFTPLLLLFARLFPSYIFISLVSFLIRLIQCFRWWSVGLGICIFSICFTRLRISRMRIWSVEEGKIGTIRCVSYYVEYSNMYLCT